MHPGRLVVVNHIIMKTAHLSIEGFKRGYQIGNMKIDKRRDSPVFDFFSFVPPMK